MSLGLSHQKLVDNIPTLMLPEIPCTQPDCVGTGHGFTSKTARHNSKKAHSSESIAQRDPHVTRHKCRPRAATSSRDLRHSGGRRARWPEGEGPPALGALVAPLGLTWASEVVMLGAVEARCQMKTRSFVHSFIYIYICIYIYTYLCVCVCACVCVCVCVCLRECGRLCLFFSVSVSIFISLCICTSISFLIAVSSPSSWRQRLKHCVSGGAGVGFQGEQSSLPSPIYGQGGKRAEQPEAKTQNTGLLYNANYKGLYVITDWFPTKAGMKSPENSLRTTRPSLREGISLAQDCAPRA